MGNGASSISVGSSSTDSKHQLVFIEFAKFKAHGSIPRNPECDALCTRVDSGDIDREEAFLIFVSHAWLQGRGGDSDPTPDDGHGSKYKLIVNGISKLIDECAPKAKKCYLWLDYSCLDQDSDSGGGAAKQLSGGGLEDIMTSCDCLFTPLLDGSSTAAPSSSSSGPLPPLSYTAKYSESPHEAWNTPGSGYLHRAWCRAEMFYACNIPTFADSNSRIGQFKNSLNHFANIGKRPHYVYGAQQEQHDTSSPPLLAPLLQNSLLPQLTPEYGQNSVPEDHVRIMELTARLKPHLDRNAEGYFGELRHQRMHGRGLLRFPSGAMYQGQFLAGKKHGTGTFVYATGNVYTGGWVDDLKHGVGDFRFVSGNTYKGNFRLDKKNGHGVFCWTSGEMYDGHWVDDRKHGKGCTKFQDGSEYSGEYFEDMMEGEGRMKYPNGDVYEGDFVDGARYGHGVLTFFATGTVYEGQFIAGAMQGRGVLRTAGAVGLDLQAPGGAVLPPGAEVYEGNFYDSERNGHGSCLYSDGEYVGQWLDGQRHGQGTFTATATAPAPSSNENNTGTSSSALLGDVYVGDWLHGLKHGNGIYKSSANVTYEGQYQEGMLHGKGTFEYPNGDVYEGVWLHDKKQGKGTYTYAADGKQWIAMWRDDELIEKVAVE